ncbi:hypothetical protein HNQ51_002292 [Inhella inkyongensis]|uniref:ArsR family transcriptional regulator n=1 Tax=Inhella inkyongensis TaxID=392593 RepID=A0A840S5J4_9BURK|nr:helix-turn-helix domain-containing protein [Inhella inkyongensis]MBB5204973.1 hypothetical protein [Inhella inkyongensis]
MPRKPTPARDASALESRIAELVEQALTRRLGPSEATRQAPAHRSDTAEAADRFWALEGLQQRDRAQGRRQGSVLYVGDVTLPSGARLAWQQQRSTEALLQTDWSALQPVIAALAHPVRLAILRACLDGERTPADLLDLDGMGTTGQLFHHLKALQAAGWLRSLQRGHYQVPGERAVPLLALLTTCMG